MDPVSTGLLVALAGGAGGEIGRQGWAGLVRLVRLPFRRDGDGDGGADGGDGADGGGDGGAGAAARSGEVELARLAAEPGDEARAQALSTALAVRAALDAEFRAALRTWQEELPPLPAGGGADSVTNIVSGRVEGGPVVQGRDFHADTFHIGVSPPPPEDPSPLR